MCIIFDANGRDANGFACCAVCGYPHREPMCHNPGCRSNMAPDKLAEIDARTAKKAAQKAERDLIREIHNRMYRPVGGGITT